MHLQDQSSQLLSSKKVRAVIQRLSFGAQEHLLVLGYFEDLANKKLYSEEWWSFGNAPSIFQTWQFFLFCVLNNARESAKQMSIFRNLSMTAAPEFLKNTEVSKVDELGPSRTVSTFFLVWDLSLSTDCEIKDIMFDAASCKNTVRTSLLSFKSLRSPLILNILSLLTLEE